MDKRVELDITLQLTPEDQEITASIVVGNEYFEWVGQDEEPCRPYMQDAEATELFVKRIEAVGEALGLPVVKTKDLTEFMEELKKNE